MPNAPDRSFIHRRPVPAWVLSATVHFVVLVLLAVFVRPIVSTGLSSEGDRPAAIVLAQTTANNEVEYFEDPTNSAADSANESPQNEPTSRPLEALPQPPSSDPLPNIDLPGMEAPLKNSPTIGSPLLNSQVANNFIPDSINNDAEMIANEAAKIRASKPVGSPAEVSIFGSAKAQGHRFVFVMDRSQSMGAQGLGVLGAARKEIQIALASLDPNHKFQVIAYNDVNAHFGRERSLKPASKENKVKAVEFVAGLAAFGSTEHHSALISALNLRPDVVFFLTDGGAPEPGAGELREISRAAGGTTSIHCIRFGFGIDQQNENFMRLLAAQNRGRYSYVDMNQIEPEF